RGVVVHRELILLTVPPKEEPLLRTTESRRILNQRIQNRPKIERRAADHFEHFARRCLLLQGLAQGAREAFDFPLKVGVGCCGRAALIRAGERRATFPTELRAGGVLVLAPQALHTRRLPSGRAANGRTGGELAQGGAGGSRMVPSTIHRWAGTYYRSRHPTSAEACPWEVV